jgi:hypothetical protein
MSAKIALFAQGRAADTFQYGAIDPIGVTLGIGISPSTVVSQEMFSADVNLRNPGTTDSASFCLGPMHVRFTDSSGTEVTFKTGLHVVFMISNHIQKFSPGHAFPRSEPYVAGPPGTYFATATEDLCDASRTHAIAHLKSATIPFIIVSK